MATRRRIGVRVATTEAARRQLMQPVVCWEKAWVTPEHAPSSTMRVYKWVKTDKKQGDEDMDQDEPVASVPPETEPPTLNVTETNSVLQSEPQTKPPSPTPPALSLHQAGPSLTSLEGADMLDASLSALGGSMNVDVGVSGDTNTADVGDLDMGPLGPDGPAFGNVDNLNQITADNSLLESALMDGDGHPFSQPVNPVSSHSDVAG
ncbi:hypothetical protein F5141DRAFT_1185434 [Pisolithus sp. B1]|nr:hypothetical protein F5141DRAFT_1185434 [Pisolithus sp. B1]